MNYFLRNIRWLAPLLLLFGAATIAATAFWAPDTTHGRAAVARQGFLAPDFSLSTPDGNPVTLSEFTGQVVVVNFWASWCPPCRKEMPALQSVFTENASKQVVILGVNATNEDTPSNAVDFASQNGVTFPILLDADGSLARTYLVNALPTTFFIDRNGIIRKVIYGGPLSEALLRVEIAWLAGE